MSLDTVHDIQIAYRKLLNSMARPGVISNLEEQAKKLEIEVGCNPSTMVLALMLLDTEVTFHVVSQRAAQITKLLNQLTYAKVVEVEQAQYIFVLNDAGSVELEKALEMAKTGDLNNPHESATVIVEADVVSGDSGLLLKGPGIKTGSVVHVKRSGDWIGIREQKNAEFPTGIDLVFVDPNHQLVCLPRTTQIVEQVIG
ncbi:phosphonate C-P lyase system protein PhnH [uncultured Brevibacillus sp.]|uniref:phosphonate C-P lyase system protein PhnH n=1 Tax=uncultured Brevibacillus sp. TaxID=169970 RepID=UPI0025963A0A|nr:phosphonate C-P lyase system protein PhnH [uncultured Brevibacillus sp.]